MEEQKKRLRDLGYEARQVDDFLQRIQEMNYQEYQLGEFLDLLVEPELPDLLAEMSDYEFTDKFFKTWDHIYQRAELAQQGVNAPVIERFKELGLSNDEGAQFALSFVSPEEFLAKDDSGAVADLALPAKEWLTLIVLNNFGDLFRSVVGEAVPQSISPIQILDMSEAQLSARAQEFIKGLFENGNIAKLTDP